MDSLPDGTLFALSRLCLCAPWAEGGGKGEEMQQKRKKERKGLPILGPMQATKRIQGTIPSHSTTPFPLPDCHPVHPQKYPTSLPFRTVRGLPSSRGQRLGAIHFLLSDKLVFFPWRSCVTMSTLSTWVQTAPKILMSAALRGSLPLLSASPKHPFELEWWTCE